MAREIFRSVHLRSMFSVTPASKGFPTADLFDLVLGVLFVIHVHIYLSRQSINYRQIPALFNNFFLKIKKFLVSGPHDEINGLSKQIVITMMIRGTSAAADGANIR